MGYTIYTISGIDKPLKKQYQNIVHYLTPTYIQEIDYFVCYTESLIHTNILGFLAFDFFFKSPNNKTMTIQIKKVTKYPKKLHLITKMN